ncbi:MAG: GNAT family protein [Waddliaceae bacterium]
MALVTKILSVVAFDFLGCDCLQVGCNKSNQISQKVMNKCGFKLEGEIRNYFPNPTQNMLENGYIGERTCLRYSLIPEDLLHLKWYRGIKHGIKIKKN